MAALCAGGLIRRLLVSVRPVELTLDRIPNDLLLRINRDRKAYLPSGAVSFQAFQDRLEAYARAAATLKQMLAVAEDAAAIPQPTPHQSDEISKLKRQLGTQTANHELYEQVRVTLLEQGKYMVESSNVDQLTAKKSAQLLVGLIVAAVVFTFGTHTPTDKDDAMQGSTDAPAAPQDATIEVVEGDNAEDSEALFDQLNLSACQVGDSVPVILLAATEEDVLHYTLQTLGSPSGCERYSFRASEDLVTLIIPEPQSVDLTEEEADDERGVLERLRDWFVGA